MRKFCYSFVFVMVISLGAGDTYALTQGQKSIGDIGAAVTWFDFGNFTNYFIQEDYDTGLYFLSMSNEFTDICESIVLDSKGENVLKPVGYNGFDSYAGSGQGETVINTDDNHYYVINSDGIKPINLDAYGEISDFSQGYATVILKSDSKKGVVDINGNLIFEDKEEKYKEFKYLGGGVFSAEISENNYDFMDKSGALLNQSHYNNDWLRDVSEDTLSVKKDSKYGFLDTSGKEIVPCIYDDAYSFSEGLAAVYRNGKGGLYR